jgi:hypothetical protein
MTDPEMLERRSVPPASGVAGATLQLRFYVARLTPNSVRAEQHLLSVLHNFPDHGSIYNLEIIDVLTHQHRALTDGIIVTPTLIGSHGLLRKTMVGDLNNAAELMAFLQSLQCL